MGGDIVSQYNEDIYKSEPAKIIHKVEEYLEHLWKASKNQIAS